MRAIGGVWRISLTACSAASRSSLVRHQSGDHTDPLRLGGVEAPGRQQEIAGHGQADVGRQDRGVGGVGDAAQELGHAEGGPVARHGDVAQHGDQEAAGLADPVDRGHHRSAAVPDGQEGEDVVPDVGRRLVTGVRAPAEVSARSEDVPGAGDDERGQVRILVDDAHGPLDAEVHRRREGVPGCGPVDHAPGDGALPLEAQTSRAEFL